MVETVLVKDIWKSLDAFAKKQGGRGYDMVLLIPVTGSLSSEKFSLVVSASWLDETAVSDLLREFLPIMRQTLGIDRHVNTIARVNFVRSTDPLVTSFTSHYPKRGQTPEVLYGAWLGGEPHDCIVVLHAHPPTKTLART